MAKVVNVYIDDQGEVEVDLVGFNGKGCHAVTEGFAKAVTGGPVAAVKKPEFNRPCDTKTKLQNRG